MTVSKPFSLSAASSGRSLAGWAAQLLRSPRGLIGIAAVMLVVGAAFKWSWLVAAGVAPLVLRSAPCLAMCALGLCMANMGRRNSGSPITGLASDSSEGAASLQSVGASCCSESKGAAQLPAKVAEE
jgi:hypothetical protein